MSHKENNGVKESAHRLGYLLMTELQQILTAQPIKSNNHSYLWLLPNLQARSNFWKFVDIWFLNTGQQITCPVICCPVFLHTNLSRKRCFKDDLNAAHKETDKPAADTEVDLTTVFVPFGEF